MGGGGGRMGWFDLAEDGKRGGALGNGVKNLWVL
jgi:hypothetical protein